jgi:NADH-quinone oxidoreductase subunit M
VNGILNWILWLPIIGVLGVILTPKDQTKTIRLVTLVTTTVTLLLSVLLYLNFDFSQISLQIEKLSILNR